MPMTQDGRPRLERPMLEPGQWVRHPAHVDWGLGQVQSAIGSRITVNFEHAGKVTVNAQVIPLQVEDLPP